MSSSYLVIMSYYKSLKNMYVDSVHSYEDFTLVKSNLIDDGIWNFACNFKATEYETFKVKFQKSKKLFYNRIPRFYILKSEPLAMFQETMKKDFDIYCSDTWFLTDVKQLNLNHTSTLKLELKLCTNKNDIIDTIMKGFSTQDDKDPYGDLSPTYRLALEQNVFKESIDFDVFHYLAYYLSEPISVVSITKHKKGSIAYLNNMTTLQMYRGRGVAKELLTHTIKNLKEIGVKTIVFATETDAYTENFYIDLGFQIYEYGICFEEKNQNN